MGEGRWRCGARDDDRGGRDGRGGPLQEIQYWWCGTNDSGHFVRVVEDASVNVGEAHWLERGQKIQALSSGQLTTTSESQLGCTRSAMLLTWASLIDPSDPAAV
jgi:hypothetical protein